MEFIENRRNLKTEYDIKMEKKLLDFFVIFDPPCVRGTHRAITKR